MFSESAEKVKELRAEGLGRQEAFGIPGYVRIFVNLTWGPLTTRESHPMHLEIRSWFSLGLGV